MRLTSRWLKKIICDQRNIVVQEWCILCRWRCGGARNRGYEALEASGPIQQRFVPIIECLISLVAQIRTVSEVPAIHRPCRLWDHRAYQKQSQAHRPMEFGKGIAMLKCWFFFFFSFFLSMLLLNIWVYYHFSPLKFGR